MVILQHAVAEDQRLCNIRRRNPKAANKSGYR